MLAEIEKIFKNKIPEIIGHYRKSAVMLLIYEEDGETYLIFEVRAKTLKHQPGDVCLPGGKIEEGETPKECAIRETMEELRLNKEDLSFIGDMDYFVSPYGSIMYPFVAKLNKKDINPNSEEVERIFKVPITYLLNNEPLLYEIGIEPELQEDFPYHLVNGGKNYKFSRGTLSQYFYQYDGETIWGFTAMIVKSFIDIIKKEAMK